MSGDTTITVCPNGPLLIRGPVRLEDVAGDEVVHHRNVIALCRCGRSARKPLCDGSHARSRFRDAADIDKMTAELATAADPAEVTAPSVP